MMNHRGSYWKTILLTAASGVGCILAAHLAAFYLVPEATAYLRFLCLAAGWICGAVAVPVVVSGLVVLKRDSGLMRGKPDIFLKLNRSRSEAAIAAIGDCGKVSWMRFLHPRWPLYVGDLVEVRPLQEISQTLDGSYCLDGLPFIPEMAQFCGQRFRVFRVVEKIYDYGKTKKLMRLKDSVLLVGLRCDGSTHGQCQAGCYLIWKTNWLKPVNPGSPEDAAASQEYRTMALKERIAESQINEQSDGVRYKCQYTELASAATSLKTLDIRQDLRPLWAGNVTVGAFFVAIMTRLFNYVQYLRGGVGFPAIFPSSHATLPVVNLNLQPGDTVRVLTKEEISRNLDVRSRNRGLWFDRDMLKQANQAFKVLDRIDRIIDDATGKMIRMKTACFVLKDAIGSGEFLRFSAQHDYSFWREAWLSREPKSESSAT